MKRLFLCLIVAALAGACTPSMKPEDAKQKLEEMHQSHRLDDVSETNFVYSAQMCDLQAVQLYLAAGMSANVTNNLGRTPLHGVAAASNESPFFEKRKEVAKLLIDKGADVNARDNDGNTPLHIANEVGNRDIAEILKGAKAAE